MTSIEVETLARSTKDKLAFRSLAALYEQADRIIAGRPLR